jgi:hypothetical protein
MLASSSSTVVEQMTHNPRLKGSSAAGATENRDRKTAKKEINIIEK